MRKLSALAVLCSVFGFGCEWLVQVDQSKIDQTSSGAAGEAGSAGMAGSGGSGGSGGTGGTGAFAGSGGVGGSGGTGAVAGSGGSGGTGGQAVVCGDGIVDDTEQCDDGNLILTDACVACVLAVCGDGVFHDGVEECDDADKEDGNGCDNNCTYTACGNSIITNGETCDDGNLTNGDGCEYDCVPTLPLGTVLTEKHSVIDIGFSQISAVVANPDGSKAITGWLTSTFDFGGGLLSANGDYDMFVARLDKNDDVLCQLQIGGLGDQQAYRLVVDSMGNMIVAGNFWDQIDFGSGPVMSAGGSDLVIVKFDSSCQLMWYQLIGNAGEQNHFYIATTPQDDIVLLTDFSDMIDFGGGLLQSAGSLDGAIVKYAPDGSYLWDEQFGDANTQSTAGGTVDAEGNIYMSGGFDGTLDFGCQPPIVGTAETPSLYDVFLAKLDASGACVWSRSFGGVARQLGARVVVDKAGNVTQSGYFAGSIDFGGGPMTSDKLPDDWGISMDMFVASFDAQGVHRWSHKIANLGGEGFLRAMAVSAVGNVGLAGYMQAGFDFGDGPLTSTGLKNAVVVEYDSTGKLLWGRAFGNGQNDRAYFEGIDFEDAKLYAGGRYMGNLTVPPFAPLPTSNDAGDAILLSLQAAAGD